MSENAWQDVKAFADTQINIADLCAAEPDRFTKFSAASDDLLLDYSKTSLTDASLQALLKLAAATHVATKRDAMFAGEKINVTENRAVLHTALRNVSGTPVLLDGKDVMRDIRASLAQLYAFADGVRAGEIVAADGQPFTDVVNIGIGG
ncbi:MAG: hypothetical protein B7Z71_07735, partial [Acidocella sp. 21-58-7]